MMDEGEDQTDIGVHRRQFGVFVKVFTNEKQTYHIEG